MEDAKTPSDWTDDEYPNGDRPHKSERWVLIDGAVTKQKYIGKGDLQGQWRLASIGGIFPGDERPALKQSATKPKVRGVSTIIPQSESKAVGAAAAMKANALLASQQSENAALKEIIRGLVVDLSTAQERSSRREQVHREEYRAAITQVKSLQGKIRSLCRSNPDAANQFGYNRDSGKFEDDDEDLIAVKVEERMARLPAELILKRKRVPFIDGDAGSSDDCIPLKRATAQSPL